MDYRIYHAVNTWVAHHTWVGRGFNDVESWGLIVLAAGACALWLLARPGGSRRWKLASGSALAAGGLGLLVNQAIAAFWDRRRPYASHPGAWHPYARSRDPSFPSDHASVAFGIAFAVFLFDRLVGSLFLAAAVLIAWGRVMIGAHYPADVGAGLVVGLASAVVVVKLARRLIETLARLVEKLTDPLLAAVWRLARR
jgi:undecaprenyl-diphosphatase